MLSWVGDIGEPSSFALADAFTASYRRSFGMELVAFSVTGVIFVPCDKKNRSIALVT